jgi:hypothetical protein
MNKRLLALLLVLLSLVSCPAQGTNLLLACSPKLRTLLAAHPEAFNAFTNACCLATRTNSVALVYFYCEDDSVARGRPVFLRTAGMPDVLICVRENQQPWDEFVCIVFELFNTLSRPQFEELLARAKTGTISRNDFPREIIRVEFERTVLPLRDLLVKMKLTRKEKAKSYFYPKSLGCPDDFEAFLSYQKKTSPQRDLTRQYQEQYDQLRSSSN